MKTRLENKDCNLIMQEYPDNYFDLAIVDPEYGININHNMGRRKNDRKSQYKKVEWDKKPPNSNYFNELFRISQNQIIWGGNYFELKPCKCYLIWDKLFSNSVSFSDCEFGWTSLDRTAKIFKYSPNNMNNRIHPTQKPIKLYEWIYNNYAKKEFKIIDTHGGSFSSLIAAHKFGLKEFVICEIDKDYFKAGKKRYELFVSQLNMFDNKDTQTNNKNSSDTCILF